MVQSWRKHRHGWILSGSVRSAHWIAHPWSVTSATASLLPCVAMLALLFLCSRAGPLDLLRLPVGLYSSPVGAYSSLSGSGALPREVCDAVSVSPREPLFLRPNSPLSDFLKLFLRAMSCTGVVSLMMNAASADCCQAGPCSAAKLVALARQASAIHVQGLLNCLLLRSLLLVLCGAMLSRVLAHRHSEVAGDVLSTHAAYITMSSVMCYTAMIR